MGYTTPRRPLPGALLTGLLLAALLAAPACNGSGPPSLGDTGYWRAKFARGEGIDDVVAQKAAAVPLLSTLLADSDRTVVNTAAMAAQQIGEPAAGTVPALLQATLRMPEEPFARQAIKAMKDAAVPHVLPLLQGSTEASVQLGVELLNGMGAAAAPAMEPLMKIIEGSYPTELKRKALVTLGSIGSSAESLIPRINEIATSNDELRQDAAMAMKRIRTEKKVIQKGGDR